MDDCLYGVETGRMFVYNDLNGTLVFAPPSHDEYHWWTEFRDDDGEYTYVSDDGTALSREEFGPIPGDVFKCAMCGVTIVCTSANDNYEWRDPNDLTDDGSKHAPKEWTTGLDL